MSTTDRLHSIKIEMRKELISKSLTASITFTTFAILVYFYHFNFSEHLFTIRSASIVVIVSSVLRLWISAQPLSENLWKMIKVCIWLNTISWAVIFSLGSYDLQAVGVDYCILVVMLTCFTSSSLFTLAYDSTLFIPFQLVILIPQSVICFHQWTVTKNNSYLISSFLFFVALIYQLKQFKEFRGQLMKRFGYQMDLETSVRELQESKTELVNKTVTLIQVSKASALGEMAGGLAHEVNNSLQVILGSVQQLERNLKTDIGVNLSYESKIETTRKATHKIKSVVESLRHFSRQMEMGPKEPSTLDEILSRSLTFCQEFLKAHGVELHISQVPLITIYGQPIQLTQILYNMIKNAFDAVEKLPQEEKWIKLDFEIAHNGILIKVCNGGPKISEEIASKIFQPFFTTKDVGVGTGLSLSSSLGIAREHQGDLYLDRGSEFTTFVMRLPYEDGFAQS